jgi:hypothetical protein
VCVLQLLSVQNSSHNFPQFKLETAKRSTGDARVTKHAVICAQKFPKVICTVFYMFILSVFCCMFLEPGRAVTLGLTSNFLVLLMLVYFNTKKLLSDFWFPKSLEFWLRLCLVYCNTKNKPLQTSASPIKVPGR